jgi:hypothetical protein
MGRVPLCLHTYAADYNEIFRESRASRIDTKRLLAAVSLLRGKTTDHASLAVF